MAATRPGLTAAEVRAAMEATLIARGMACAYPSIVTPHGEILHSERYDARLADGDLLLADVGAETPGGWAGDVTRTWPASGQVFVHAARDLRSGARRAEAGHRRGDARAAATSTFTCSPARRWRPGWSISASCAATRSSWRPTAWSRCCSRTASATCWAWTCTTWRTWATAPATPRAASAPRTFGLRSLRLDRDLEPGMAVTIEPGFYIKPAILARPRADAVAGDRLDRGGWRSSPTSVASASRTTCWSPRRGREVLTDAIPKSIAAVEAAMSAA